MQDRCFSQGKGGSVQPQVLEDHSWGLGMLVWHLVSLCMLAQSRCDSEPPLASWSADLCSAFIYSWASAEKPNPI